MEPRPDPLAEEPGRVRRLGIGRGGLLTLGLAVASLALLGIWIRRVRSLDGLPDVGDPFDVAAALRPIEMPEDENAYVLYTVAKQKLFPLPAALLRVDFISLSWSTAGDAVLAFATQNRPALLTWREGTERPDALYDQPGNVAFDTPMRFVNTLRLFAVLAALEASHDEENGAMEDAWLWYRAMLRCSRHVGRHGMMIERVLGAAIHAVAAARVSSAGRLIRASMPSCCAEHSTTHSPPTR